jgi:hypothetical protein
MFAYVSGPWSSQSNSLVSPFGIVRHLPVGLRPAIATASSAVGSVQSPRLARSDAIASGLGTVDPDSDLNKRGQSSELGHLASEGGP